MMIMLAGTADSSTGAPERTNGSLRGTRIYTTPLMMFMRPPITELSVVSFNAVPPLKWGMKILPVAPIAPFSGGPDGVGFARPFDMGVDRRDFWNSE